MGRVVNYSPVRGFSLLPDPIRTEADITGKIREYLIARGLQPFRANAAAFKGRVNTAQGLPDLFSVLPGGRFLAVEVKKPGAKKRANEAKQQEVLAWLRKQGALVIVARSVEDVEQGLLAG